MFSNVINRVHLFRERPNCINKFQKNVGLERSEAYNEPPPPPPANLPTLFVDPTREKFDFSNHRVKKTFIKPNSHHRR